MSDKPNIEKKTAVNPASENEKEAKTSTAEVPAENRQPDVLPVKSEKKTNPALAAGDQSDRPAQNKRLPITIDLLRHGKVATPSLFSAPVDEPLGMEGWKQLTVATHDTYWDAVFAPPTRRCHDYARLLSQRLECEFVVDPRYCEFNFGEWVGLSQQEIMLRDPELLQQYYFQPRRFRAPGGESMDEFLWRIQAAWEDLLNNYQGQHLLILTHTNVIRMILSKALDLLYQKVLRFDVGYARFTRLQVYPDGEVVLVAHGLPSVRDFNV